MGVIIVNVIMTLHIVLSTLDAVRASFIGCYVVGIVGVFAIYS